jgi:hypothetical protein
MLYEPSGKVLTLRASGEYSHHSGNAKRETVIWQRFAKR